MLIPDLIYISSLKFASEHYSISPKRGADIKWEILLEGSLDILSTSQQ